MALLKITNYTFDPANRTVTLNGLTRVDPQRVRLIRNDTRNIIYYMAGTSREITATGNTVTLPSNVVWDTDRPTDVLDIQYGDTEDLNADSIKPIDGWPRTAFTADTQASLAKADSSASQAEVNAIRDQLGDLEGLNLVELFNTTLSS